MLKFIPYTIYSRMHIFSSRIIYFEILQFKLKIAKACESSIESDSIENDSIENDNY